MGFSEEVSRRVLNECAWDVNKAWPLAVEVGMDGMSLNDGRAFALGTAYNQHYI